MSTSTALRQDHPTAADRPPIATPQADDWREVHDRLIHPCRFTLSDDESMVLYHARPGMLSFEGLSLSTWHWGIEGPRVVLVHGWESRSTHWQPWIEALLVAGFRVSTIDLPAHGHSSGATCDVVLSGRVARAFGAQLGAVHAVVGHSMGSAAALYACAHGMQVAASVHISGPSSLKRMLNMSARAYGLSPAGTSALHAAFEHRTGHALSEMDVPALSTGFNHPALIWHDPQDAEVPFVEAQQLALAWPAASLIEATGLGHRRTMRDPHVIATSIAAIQRAVGR